MSLNISNTAQASEQANKETDTGRRMVELTVEAINDLSEYIESSSTIIHQVGRDSENINSVIDVIRGIAEQTNLLALNATNRSKKSRRARPRVCSCCR
ncbi:methyl-accepting chemotaxis protein [Psychromonas sp. KJ10-10]|uniref:methyl-accepting chemotaxis protein n=1 Tax=Psychromonas sp. KJ10-10 TaxID=3391823 RepID=UPI0039B5EDAD